MTRLISAPAESGQLRHYFVRESTLDGWRPQFDQFARLVAVSSDDAEPQAAIGDIVRVYRSMGAGDRTIVSHWGPAGQTAGTWEHLIPVVLQTSEGSTLDQLSSEDRVAVLVAAVRELTPEERVAVWEALVPDAYRRLDAIQVQEKARADRAEQLLALYRRGYEARGKLNVAYRTGGHPSEKTLDELGTVAHKLWELEPK